MAVAPDQIRKKQQELLKDMDGEVRSPDAMVSNEELHRPWWHQLKYLLAGILFGIILVKSELISWYRIQEMFHLQSFHLFGVIGSAVVTGMLSVWLIRKFNIRTIYGGKVVIPTKKFNKGNIYGGLIFGVGWAITGACPGPLFAQIGNGATVVVVTLLSAIAGTWFYGWVRTRLPH